MAIDSVSKRASALSAGVIALSLVVPSGAIDQQARQTIGDIYSGILSDAPISTPDLIFTVISTIQGNGKSVISTITDAGQGTSGSMSGEFAVQSSIQSAGKGIVGEL